MARVKFGTAITGIRGHHGGNVYSRNTGGNFIKPLMAGVYKQTPGQTFQRGVLAYGAGGWWALSNPNRAAWNAFALAPNEIDKDAWGYQRYLSGFQWYCRCSCRHATVLESANSNPPTGAAALAITGFTLHLHQQPGDPCLAQWTGGQWGVDDAAIVYVSIAVKPGAQTKTSGGRLVLAKKNPDDLEEDITSEIIAQFGNIRATWIAFGEIWRQADLANRSPVATCRVGVGSAT